jgi:hypothetical protein
MVSALAAQRAGDLETAERLYRSALALDPDNIDALHMLGVVFFSRKSFDKAEPYLRKALSLCPASSPALKPISHNLQMLKEARSAPGAPQPSGASLRIVRECGLAEAASAMHQIHPPQHVLLSGLDYLPDIASPPVGPAFLFPAIRAFELENAVVDAESQLPTNDRAVVFPDFVDFSRHLLPELRYRDYVLSDTREFVLHRKHWPDPGIGELPAAIVMTSGYWQNWAHFLTEVLPKILIADAHEPWDRLPVIASAMSLGNAHELCRKLIAPEREVVRACGSLNVHRAGYVSSVGWVPFEYLYDATVAAPPYRQSDTAFSPYALGLVRHAAHRLIDADPDCRGARRLYLKRNSRVRQTINAERVEAGFSRWGFTVISPETLTVEEQIRLFSDAEVIAGQAGAAIANMIFSPPGCRVLVYTAYSQHGNFGYWPNIAHALGHRLHYLFGEQVGVPMHPVHPDCVIDISKIDAALEQLLAI